MRVLYGKQIKHTDEVEETRQHFTEFRLDDGNVLRDVDGVVRDNDIEFFIDKDTEIDLPHSGEKVILDPGSIVCVYLFSDTRYIYEIRLGDKEKFMKTRSPLWEKIPANSLRYSPESKLLWGAGAAQNGPLIPVDTPVGRLEGVYVGYSPKDGSPEMVLFPPEKNMLLYGLELKEVHALVFDKPMRVHVNGPVFRDGQDISDKIIQSDGQRVVHFDEQGEMLIEE